MTDLTMSQFASKDDLLAAQAARIAELESQLEAIGAGGVEPLRKQAAAPHEEAIAEIVSASHDQAEFGERAINFLRDFQHLEYGTKLYPGPLAVQPDAPVVLGWVRRGKSGRIGNHFHTYEPHCDAAVRDDGGEKIAVIAATAHPAEGVPVQPLQKFESPRAKILMQAWQEGFAACRDAEYVGEEAENDAFNQSMTLNHCIAEDELHATQPAAQGVMEQFIESQHKLAAMIARTEHAEAKLDAIEFEAKAYRWLRDENDWYAEPRLDAEDGTVWKLTMYSPQEIIDPTDDDSLDAAVLAALAAQAGAQP